MSADQLEQDLNKIDGKTILSKSKDRLCSYQKFQGRIQKKKKGGGRGGGGGGGGGGI